MRTISAKGIMEVDFSEAFEGSKVKSEGAWL